MTASPIVYFPAGPNANPDDVARVIARQASR
jgi:hypothetical protein